MDKNIVQQADFSLLGKDRKGYICLDLNENIGLVSKDLFRRVREFEPDLIEQYPNYSEFYKKLSNKQDLPIEKISIFNGADSAIIALTRLLCGSSARVVMPTPTFPIYDFALKGLGLTPEYLEIEIDSKGGVRFPITQVIEAITKKGAKVVLLCDPNNPLGTRISTEHMATILETARKHNTFVVIDEAYIDFSNQIATSFNEDFIIRIRTFSKTFGMAGLRLGYIIATEKLTKHLTKLRLPWGVNHFAVHVGSIFLDEQSYFEEEAKKMITRREELCSHFDELDITYIESQANFVLTFHESASTFTTRMAKQNILVKNFEEIFAEGGKQAVRITVPDDETLTGVKNSITNCI